MTVVARRSLRIASSERKLIPWTQWHGGSILRTRLASSPPGRLCGRERHVLQLRELVVQVVLQRFHEPSLLHLLVKLLHVNGRELADDARHLSHLKVGVDEPSVFQHGHGG